MYFAIVLCNAPLWLFEARLIGLLSQRHTEKGEPHRDSFRLHPTTGLPSKEKHDTATHLKVYIVLGYAPRGIASRFSWDLELTRW